MKIYNEQKLRRRKIYEFFSWLESFIKFVSNDFVEHEGQNLIWIIWNYGQQVGEMLSWSLRDLLSSLKTQLTMTIFKLYTMFRFHDYGP